MLDFHKSMFLQHHDGLFLLTTVDSTTNNQSSATQSVPAVCAPVHLLKLAKCVVGRDRSSDCVSFTRSHPKTSKLQRWSLILTRCWSLSLTELQLIGTNPKGTEECQRLGTFKCSLLQRVQKENTKTSLWTFKCKLIQNVQKEISKSSLGTFKCILGTYDCEMTTPPPHPYSNPVKSLISTFFTD